MKAIPSITFPEVEEIAQSNKAEGHLGGVPKSSTRYKIWIDLENSPHVPFFLPIVREMEERNCEVFLTARDCFQVCGLADLAGLKYRRIGRHYGKNPIAKLLGLGIRVMQLASLIVRERPDIGVSHCSRSLIALCGVLGILNVNIMDYEFADQRLTALLGSRSKKWVLTPAIVPRDGFQDAGILPNHILHYPGIKEDVYVPFFEPDPLAMAGLDIFPEDIVVILRPPATEAHYHNPESDKLLASVIEVIESHPKVKAILLPRTRKQETELRQSKPALFASKRIQVPDHSINGLDLIWRSDIVISGGGTMNREAAALGVPVYSFFRGALGAIDAHLAEAGKLIFLKSDDDVREKLKLVPRDRTKTFTSDRGIALQAVVNQIFAVLEDRD